jgi:aminopeptidase-like protein
LKQWDSRKFTYRFVLAPETIGSLAYLSKMGRHLREKLVGGFVLTCLGGPEESLSYKRTRRGDAYVDTVVTHFDEYADKNVRMRPFNPRKGSDERQYCSPGFNFPVGQFARTVYTEYEGYHNSLDSKEFMGIEPLVESAATIEAILETVECGGYYERTQPFGEPMLSKYDLYPSVNDPSERKTEGRTTEENSERPADFIGNVMTLLNYADGHHSVIDIASELDTFALNLRSCLVPLLENNLLRPVPHKPNYVQQMDIETVGETKL